MRVNRSIRGGATGVPRLGAFCRNVCLCSPAGGIPEPQIGEAISALKRMMKPGSWIVLAENTTRKPNSPAWSFRAVRWYEEAFSDLALKAKTSYNDLGEKITVFIGGGPA